MPSYSSILSTNQSKPINFGAINVAPGAVTPQSIAPNAALAPKTAAPAVAAPQPTYSASGGAIIPSTTASTAIGSIDTSAPVDVSTLSGSTPLNLPQLPQAQIPNYATMDFSSYFQNSPEQDRLQSEKSDLTKGITDTQTKLGTKAAKTAELETAAGIPGLSKQLKELNDQIRNVQSQSLDAYNTSEDRKAPTFVIQGEQAAIERLRAAKTFGLAAAASAIQGNIALAEDQVTRAIDAEFGGLEQEIENKKFLLQLNRDDFNEAEKRQADERTVALDQAKEGLAQQRTDRENILKVMLEAAANGADNRTLTRIQNAKTPEEAISAAGDSLASADTQVVDAGGRRFLINSKTGETVKDLGAVPSSGGSSSNTMIDNERALLGQFLGSPIVKDYNVIVSQKLAADKIITDGVGGPADLALVFSFMKSLDPNSVVRETEYDNAAKSGNIFAGAFAKFNGYLKPEGGFLPESVRGEFQNLLNGKLASQQQQYDNFKANFEELAGRQGLNPQNVTLDLAGALPPLVTPSDDDKENIFTSTLGITNVSPSAGGSGFLGSIGSFFGGLFGK